MSSLIRTEEQDREVIEAFRAAAERIAKLYDYNADHLLTAINQRSFGSRSLHWDAREEIKLYWEAFKLSSERTRNSEAA